MEKVYQVVVKGLDELPQGKEIELPIRDLSAGIRKYNGLYVKAIVSSTPDKLDGSDTLRLISSNGYIYPDTWAIKVLEDIGPYPSERDSI